MKADPEEIRRWFTLAYAPGDTFELRCPNTQRGVVSGYYTNVDAAVKDAVHWSGRAESVYSTLNPVLPDLRARASNRCREYVQGGMTTGDKHILHRNWWLVDCDPCRPKGVSSTDAEHEAARERALVLRDWLHGQGFPWPILADSGNGFHLLYRIFLPNDDASRDLLSQSLQALAAQFSDALVDVDVSTFNAARVCKVYGTLAAKGDPCPDLGRVHRLARLIEVPEPLVAVDFGGAA